MNRRQWSVKDEDVLRQYKGMIYKLAISSWRQLPASVKMWVDPEDLVADAYLAILASAKFRYQKNKGSKSTFIWVGISNLFLNYASSHQTKKRFGWRVPIDNIDWMGKKDKVIIQWEALNALAMTYREASEDCRSAIKIWFGPESVRAKHSQKAKKTYSEFRNLAEKNRLSVDDCRALMQVGVWIP